MAPSGYTWLLKYELEDRRYISTNTFFQGSCKEHVLPEEGEDGDHGGGSGKRPLPPRLGWPMCSTRLKDNRVELLIPMKSSTSEDLKRREICKQYVFDPAMQKFNNVVVLRLYGFLPDDATGLLGSSTKGWSCWTSPRQTLLSTSMRSFSSLRRASKTEVISSFKPQLGLSKSQILSHAMLSTYFLHVSNILNFDSFHMLLTSKYLFR